MISDAPRESGWNGSVHKLECVFWEMGWLGGDCSLVGSVGSVAARALDLSGFWIDVSDVS